MQESQPLHPTEDLAQTMINISTSIWLGITFVFVGAINVWLVLQASARVRNEKAGTRLIAAHRIGAQGFVLTCVGNAESHVKLEA